MHMYGAPLKSIWATFLLYHKKDIQVVSGIALFARQPHRVAADGIRQTIHRAVGHDTIQRGRAHTVACHLPLLREQARRRYRGVVRRQTEVAIGEHISHYEKLQDSVCTIKTISETTLRRYP